MEGLYLPENVPADLLAKVSRFDMFVPILTSLEDDLLIGKNMAIMFSEVPSSVSLYMNYIPVLKKGLETFYNESPTLVMNRLSKKAILVGNSTLESALELSFKPPRHVVLPDQYIDKKRCLSPNTLRYVVVDTVIYIYLRKEKI